MWIDTDIAIPAFDEQIVKIKVADFAENYVTEGYYSHREQVWYDKNGYCLNDNVYKWSSDNKPDMREKVKEYIAELDEEISRCEKLYEENSVNYSDPTRSLATQCRVETLVQVKCDLESRLEELV